MESATGFVEPLLTNGTSAEVTPPADAIGSTPPTAAAPPTHHLSLPPQSTATSLLPPPLCVRCGGASALVCGRCSVRVLCGRACQQLDWVAGHRDACSADMAPGVAPRCCTRGCTNFASSVAGTCNACTKGVPPALQSITERVAAGEAAAPASVVPDDAARVAAKLARSLVVARAYAVDAPGGGSPVPFAHQREVCEEELAFRVADGVFVGSEYAAIDAALLRGMGVSRIINATDGSRTVPNVGERVPEWEVAYVSLPLQDRIGFSVERVIAAIHETARLIDAWRSEGRVVFVHCSAGLCRSASLVMGWLMLRSGLSLAEAIGAFTSGRGRPPVPSLSYWSALCSVERDIAAVQRAPPLI